MIVNTRLYVIFPYLIIMGMGAFQPLAKAGVPNVFPQSYNQSGFTTNDPPSWFYKTYEKKKLRAECFSLFFEGAEVLDLNVDTEVGREDVRELSDAMRDLSNEIGWRFNGFWSFPRLPGFFWEDDINDQPADYRACSLKSNCDIWPRVPSYPEENESKIKFTAEVLDITNQTAVNELLANIAQVFDWDGPVNESIGPLYGYIVYNEWLLSSNYESVWSEHEKEHDVDSPNRVMRLNHQTHYTLVTDNDPYYSYLNPPKRAITLFTPGARDSFAAYADARGYSYNKLPAVRNEFNDDDDSLVPFPVAPGETEPY
ncbi:MAG: hypothetical protein JSV03_05450, partial [Planctomycetota bacterium]